MGYDIPANHHESTPGSIRDARAAQVDLVLTDAKAALIKALGKHAAMNSPHEGWSVILEELEELREHVRGDTGRSADARKEALQVAAMWLRYALDLCD